MQAGFAVPRVQAVPLVDRAALCVDGKEVVGYNFGVGKPRPFVYPVLGPSGRMLTRMGHPNPVGHEHHRSVWFGHQKVAGANFWEERMGTDVQVRHRRVRLYHDGPEWAGLLAELDWWAHGQTLLTQKLILALEPRSDGGYLLDLQSRFEAPGGPVELGQTNFGFLGVRVAKTISEQFGGGRLTSSEGAEGEPAIFARTARWVDYSGPVAPDATEGIAYFDHPDNPHHPTPWHVRRDGWMEAAFCLEHSWGVAAGHPLDLRYRLWIHPGPADRRATDREWDRFALTPPYTATGARGGSLPALHRGEV